MNRRAFAVILVLSVVITYGVAILDALQRNSLLAGKAGLPFRFSSTSFFRENTNLLFLFLDIAFWFVIIWIVWLGIRKLFNK